MLRPAGTVLHPPRRDTDVFARARFALVLGIGLLLGVTISHAAGASTQVTGPIPADATWNVAGSPYIVAGNVLVLPGVTLTIRPGVQVRLDPGQSLVIDNGTLLAEGTPDSIITFKRNQAGRWGVVAGFGAELTFRHCRLEWSSDQPIIYNTDHEGMISNAVGNTIVEDCVLSNAGLDATEFQGGSVVFRRNLVQYTYRQGFNSWDHCSTTVEDCRVVSCFDDAYSITSAEQAEINFHNNVAIDVGDDGLDIDHFGIQTRMSCFEAYNCNDKGVSVSEFSSQVIIENSVVADANEGFTATAHSTLSIFNCVAYRCNRAFAAYEKYMYAGGARIVVGNSIAWNSVTPVYLDSISTATIYYSILDTPAPYPGAHNGNTDPRFMNADSFVFSLAPDSPGIDAGYSDGMPQFDILGNPRIDVPSVPDTGALPIRYYDIGAYEFMPQTTPIGEPAPTASRFQLRAAPIPASGPVEIAFSLPAAAEVEVQIYDAAGRAIECVHRGMLAAGPHELTWLGATRAPRGVYFVRLTAGGEEAVEKIVRAR